MKALSSQLYFWGCLLLVPSSGGLMLGATVTTYAICGFIVACTCLSIAALIDIYKAVLANNQATSLYSPICMLFGALLFLSASLLYLPYWSNTLIFNSTLSNIGTWLFRFGSLAYLAGNYRLIQHWLLTLKRDGFCKTEDVTVAVGILVFMLGSLLYIAGGVVTQITISKAMLTAFLWLLGSCSFAVGGTIFLNLHRRTKS